MKNKFVLRFLTFAFLFTACFACKDDEPDTDPKINDPVVVDPIKDPDPNEEPDPDENPDEKPVVIDQEGGQIQSSDQDLLITIPEGTFEGAVEISVLENEVNEFANGIGTMYSLSSEVDQFDEPVTLTFNYNEGLLPDGVSPDLITVAFRRDGGEWQRKPNAVLDKSAMAIKVETDHFSDWTLAADSMGFIDVLIPFDTFQVNMPFDKMVLSDLNAGDYSDTLIFDFEDKATGLATSLYEVGSLDFTPGTEITMSLGVTSDNQLRYGGSVLVIFSEFATNSGGLVVASFSGEVSDPEKRKFPVKGKFVVKRK